MPDLSIDDLHVRLGDNDVLKGVSFTVPQGQVVALLGPSGSGKTTILRSVAGLERPYRGTIRIGDTVFFDGAKAIDVPAEKRGLGLVFQSYALWPHRTVFENVAYGLKLRGIGRDELARRAKAALAQIGLDHLAERYPHQLSGGQQQRVALARALVYEPPVILLDEPLSNLDAKLREEARAWLRRLITSLGLSALCVTHDQVEAMAIADRVLLLEGGRIAQAGTPTELYGAPTSLFAAEFMGANNRIAGVVETVEGGAAVLRVGPQRLSGIARGSLTVGASACGVIRIERMRLADGPGENRVVMRIATSMFLGERYEHVFETDGISIRVFTPGPIEGTERWLEFPREALWIF
ncbi:MAG: ABC transporter ATP-binding protein [Gemmatimonas sp.]